MKKGTVYLLISFILLVSGIGYFVWRTMQNAKKIKFSLGRLTLSEKDRAEAKKILDEIDTEDLLTNAGNVIEALSTIQVQIEVLANNFSPQSFTVKQAYAELRNKKSGGIIARIDEPLQQKLKIKANAQTSIFIPLRINGLSVLQVATQIEFLSEVMKAIGGQPSDLSKAVELRGHLRAGWFNLNFVQ